ncbi:MAG: ATP-binding protein, partial [Turicibacter sp.]
QGSIWVNCNIVNKELIVEVIDDGPGFTSEGLLNAMNPFYKEQENVNNAHFGLGLHICRLLTEKHGGYLKLDNHHPSGAKITANFGKVI